MNIKNCNITKNNKLEFCLFKCSAMLIDFISIYIFFFHTLEFVLFVCFLTFIFFYVRP